jgi:hypothetical protein
MPFNLQALHLDALSDVDNTTQSLLMFSGNESVHGLYDILLNYKYGDSHYSLIPFLF